jgi:hypothetical protein
MTKNTGGPAFPYTDYAGFPQKGMTLRDYFAGLAMQTLIDNEVVFADVPPEAYRMADAMLKVREA